MVYLTTLTTLLKMVSAIKLSCGRRTDRVEGMRDGARNCVHARSSHSRL